MGIHRVNADDFVAPLQQGFGGVKPNEPGVARHQHGLLLVGLFDAFGVDALQFGHF